MWAGVFGIGARPPAFFSIRLCAFEVLSKVRIAKSRHFIASFILIAGNFPPILPQYSYRHFLDSVSLFGVQLQTKSCVLCGKKDKNYHGVKFLEILPQGTQGSQRGGNTLESYLSLTEAES